MNISILTLFPEVFEIPLRTSILGKSKDRADLSLDVINIRKFARDKHHTTDDRPFGGGPGMVMMVEPIDLALSQLGVKKNTSGSKIILLSAKGASFSQEIARNYTQLEHLVLICGHYQDVDQRVVDHLVDQELSIGPYILTGGETAALVVVDAVSRLIPGVLGNSQSTLAESHHQKGAISHPAYTRPAEYRGWRVPDVLLSGDHQGITDWKSRHSKLPSDQQDAG